MSQTHNQNAIPPDSDSDSSDCDSESSVSYPVAAHILSFLQASPQAHQAFPFQRLPKDIRFCVYDVIAKQAARLEPPLGLVSNQHHEVTLSSSPALLYLLSGLQTKKNFVNLLRVDKTLRSEVEAYLKRYIAKSCRDLALSIIWFEDLGPFLTLLGPMGRHSLHNVSLEWDNVVRPEATPLFKFQQSHWRGKNSAAEIFALLAECPNLCYLGVKIDPCRLLLYQPNGWMASAEDMPRSLHHVPGMAALRGLVRTVKERDGGKVDVRISSRDQMVIEQEDVPLWLLRWLRGG